MRQHWSMILAVLLAACSGASTENTSGEGVSVVLPDEANEVTVEVLKKRPFEHELVSNGKITAGEQADLHFESEGVLAQVYVKNGERVRAGQKLAELDKFELANQVVQAKDALAKARLDLQDVLIGQGYAANDTAHVPQEVMKLARVKSGYDQSLAQYELACRKEERATLVAPFDGVVANLFAKPYNPVDLSEAFCTVVGSRNMEADFTVLESELPLISIGDKVTVTPYSGIAEGQEGHITEINPLVDENGMVRVKAMVQGGRQLFAGMNVRIHVHRSVKGQLVIPKSAVVLRSGKQVVFTLKAGKAQWVYVQTALENAESYSVADGLQEGDTVIVTGNVNLAHEAPVKVIEK